MTENYSLSHLKELEAESIHIIREVAAEFENPVMLYSIGKDSSVMVRLAEKAFAPGRPPFPLMHIDSKWKFKEMLAFRDWYAKEHGWNLIVESNMEAFKAGVVADGCVARVLACHQGAAGWRTDSRTGIALRESGSRFG